MELPSNVLEEISSVEKDIRNCQDHIDRCRAQNPLDQQFQLSMDIAQSALNLRKKRLRDTKTIISKVTQ